MDLNELFPHTGKLKIESFDKEYELRAMNLADEIWLKNEYGESLSTMFNANEVDLDGICRLTFRLIIDKSDFEKQTLDTFDEDGNKLKLSVGGVKILSNMIKSEDDKLLLINAVAEVINKSRGGEVGGKAPVGK